MSSRSQKTDGKNSMPVHYSNASGQVKTSENEVSPRKRSKSPEGPNHGTEEKGMQLRSSKRKKDETSKAVVGTTAKQRVPSKKKSEKLSCQKEATLVPKSVPQLATSALVIPNSEANSAEKMESLVPKSSDNINKPSTSSTITNFEAPSTTNLPSSGPIGKLRVRKPKMPKWSSKDIPESDSNSNENICPQNSNQEHFEEELKCSICSEIFIRAVTLNCSHSFCQFCISKWRKEHSTCPICRQRISSQNSTLVLDKCVERIIESSKEETKTRRNEIIEYRNKNKEPDPNPNCSTSVYGNNNGTFAFGAAMINVLGGNMFFSDDSSDEEHLFAAAGGNDYEEDDYDEDDEYHDGEGDDGEDDWQEEEEDNEPDEGADYDDPDEEGDHEQEWDEYSVEGEEEDEYEDAEEEDESDFVEEEEEYDEEASYEDADGNSDEEDSSSSDDFVCFNCGKEGHFARNCPKAVPYNGLPGVYFGGYGACFRCNQKGHWANGCPN